MTGFRLLASAFGFCGVAALCGGVHFAYAQSDVATVSGSMPPGANITDPYLAAWMRLAPDWTPKPLTPGLDYAQRNPALR